MSKYFLCVLLLRCIRVIHQKLDYEVISNTFIFINQISNEKIPRHILEMWSFTMEEIFSVLYMSQNISVLFHFIHSVT